MNEQQIQQIQQQQRSRSVPELRTMGLELVVLLAAPVILIDEVLKVAARVYNAAKRSAAKKAV